MPSALRLHPDDDVLVALRALARGTVVDGPLGPLELRADVPAGHKIAIRGRACGEPVRRWGRPIGAATAPIWPGDHVHLHNLEAGLRGGADDLLAEAGADLRPAAAPPPGPRTFDGYLREDGRVGTRNYLAVISTVSCSATVSRMIADRFRDVQRGHPSVDGVLALVHRSGCGMIGDGDAHRMLVRTLAGYALHPNVAGFVLVALGCEVNQVGPLAARLSEAGGAPVRVVGIQEVGGTVRAVEAGVAALAALLPRAAAAHRTPQALSRLVLATNCGGSDGFSGITANPALGCAVDELVRHGGTAILGETTEIHGAERSLVRRAVRPEVARKLLERIEWWRRHLRASGGDVDQNPAPGNLEGGITTVLEKALGGAAKGGTGPLVDVVEYAERAVGPGLVFMDTPGFDPVSVTGMVAGGANLVAFTTGRGSVFGCKPVPSLKLATTSALFRRMPDDMDVDCGVVLEGASLEEVGRAVLDELVEVASGKRTRSEQLGFGEEEFAPWLPGPTV